MGTFDTSDQRKSELMKKFPDLFIGLKCGLVDLERFSKHLEANNGQVTPAFKKYFTYHWERIVSLLNISVDLTGPMIEEALASKPEVQQVIIDSHKVSIEINSQVRVKQAGLAAAIEAGGDISEQFGEYRKELEGYLNRAIDVACYFLDHMGEEEATEFMSTLLNKTRQHLDAKAAGYWPAWMLANGTPEDNKSLKNRIPWPLLKIIEFSILPSLNKMIADLEK